LLAIALLACPARSPARTLPLGTVPPGRVFLVVLPHHDGHTWEYGFAGLIAKLVGAGYTGYYIRITNDEKDGALGWPRNDIVNHRETIEAARSLGIKDVFNLWGHYDRSPDHRKTARAVAEAAWAAGNPGFYPEHLGVGLQPHRVRYRYSSQHGDYGPQCPPAAADGAPDPSRTGEGEAESARARRDQRPGSDEENSGMADVSI
jgi:LmbE family N-acetylglucosaminyl deacetylase